LHRKHHPHSRFALELVVYQDGENGAVIVLTHYWDTDRYEIGAGYGRIAIEVEDAYDTCATIKSRGGLVVREAGPMKHGSTVIAFVEDPDGYKIELIQRAGRED